MRIPYRTKKILGRVGIALLIILAAALVAWICWMIWLGRYMVYTRDGAKLDFSLSEEISGNSAAPKPTEPPVSIYYNEGENAINTSTEMVRLTGYYVELDALRADVNAVKQEIQALPKDMAVMLDVKNALGGTYYSSGVVETRASSVDIAAVDDLIAYLKKSGRYTIARLPALRDCEYARNHILEAITDRRGYVWIDTERCYWLDPTKQSIQNYVIEQILELRSLGFHEVVLTDYDIPTESHVIFNQDRGQVLDAFAGTIASACITDAFAVSFVKDPGFSLPADRCRLYLEAADAAAAPTLAAQSGLADPAVQLVFLTENHDTRFDSYGVLRPLSSAH